PARRVLRASRRFPPRGHGAGDEDGGDLQEPESAEGRPRARDLPVPTRGLAAGAEAWPARSSAARSSEMKTVPTLVIVGLAAGLAGAARGGGGARPPGPRRPGGRPARAPAAPRASRRGASARAWEPRALPPMKYQAKGRRDPFENLEVREGASGPTLASAKL